MKPWTLPLILAGAAVMTAVPEAVSAQSGQAVVNTLANVRAGPAADYPVVAQAAAGMPVTVYGCLSGYTWCDIGLPGTRGWIYAGLLSYPYQGNPVPVLNYGTMIGLPIVTFSIGSYWGSHYRNRSWYHDQRYWHRPPHWGGPGSRPPGHYPGPGHRPPGMGHGPGPRPPGHAAGPGSWHPGHGSGPGPGHPPGHGAGPRPPRGGHDGYGGRGRGHGGRHSGAPGGPNQ
jgi:uncharacterized protein YraI